MGLGSEDLAILEKLKLDMRPVGVKYLVRPPDSAGRLDRRIALCEMLKRAQEGDCFYADVENHTCEAGPYILGQREIEPQFVSGQYGAGLGAFKEPPSRRQTVPLYPQDREGRNGLRDFCASGQTLFRSGRRNFSLQRQPDVALVEGHELRERGGLDEPILSGSGMRVALRASLFERRGQLYLFRPWLRHEAEGALPRGSSSSCRSPLTGCPQCLGSYGRCHGFPSLSSQTGWSLPKR